MKRHDVFRQFFRGSDNTVRMTRRITVKFIIAIVIVVSLVVLMRFSMWDLRVVRGHSMEPTYSDGNVLLVRRHHTDTPSVGDVVVALVVHNDVPSAVVKRVAAVPGDTVEVTEHAVIVNGETVEEMLNPCGEARTWALKEDEYFLLGDNAEDSVDSRVVGPYNAVQISGIVVRKIL